MRATAVLERGGPWWASQQNMAAAVLGRRPGVLDVEVNPVSETATVVFDPTATSLAELRDWVVECGYHCAGQSVPAHLCDPMAEPDPPAQADRTRPAEHGGDVAVAEPPADARHAPEPMPSPHEVMGHGGHAGMSMAAMVADMRNRLRGPTPVERLRS
ncbi:heavy-metal-associated domain-containing protein [Streptomyces sp. NPDC017435]|uniref:heavy-metal-associated domain-containing protein n=1 Tax=Streptomyces sp. NPDC017435 TaxID=3364995 RepID=UPI0037AA3DDF